jgi:hypothetical protein
MRYKTKKERVVIIAVGDNRGWDIESSGGMPVWQFIQGGWFAPIPKKLQ